MHKKISIISPADDSIIAERNLTTKKERQEIIQSALSVQNSWNEMLISDRATICHKAIDYLVSNSDILAKEITQQMGRPIRYTAGEIAGTEERARYMIDIAEQALADIEPSALSAHGTHSTEDNENIKRFIRRVPLGIVFTIAPWNYPYLTAINSVIPALMSGNCVLLKHAKQTFLCAERLQEAFDYAGLPKGVFQYLHMDHAQTNEFLKDPAVNFISFTGSFDAGMMIEKNIAGLNKGLALELGGKDPAYVRYDADLMNAVENLVDGVYFNSGQSCCAVERIYVHEQCYQKFVDDFIELVEQYKLGNPFEPETTLGPMINAEAADKVREQIKAAINAGAKPCINKTIFSETDTGAYLAPEVLINVDHTMDVMQEESFGPVVGIMKVKNDDEAITLMNDSRYGLTASIWTDDIKSATTIGNALNTGTVFMNRCDYLDPALAWTGVKDSGRGCSLSRLGYEQLTRAKSFHLRTF
jgi:acyl-CoA reductase-like NAD-dependent aldehyde dehydrogenase